MVASFTSLVDSRTCHFNRTDAFVIGSSHYSSDLFQNSLIASFQSSEEPVRHHSRRLANRSRDCDHGGSVNWPLDGMRTTAESPRSVTCSSRNQAYRRRLLFVSTPPNNPVTLNGKTVEGNEALASGDVLFIGPFRLDIDDTEESLVIRVSLQIGMVASNVDSSSAVVTTDQLVTPVEGKKPAKPRAAPIAGTKALDIFWDKRIREAGKEDPSIAVVSQDSAAFGQGPVQLVSHVRST